MVCGVERLDRAVRVLRQQISDRAAEFAKLRGAETSQHHATMRARRCLLRLGIGELYPGLFAAPGNISLRW